MSVYNAEDIESIKILRSRYFRSLDMADHTMMRTLFTEDLVTDLKGSDYHFQFNSREEFIEFVADAINADLVAHHIAHLPEITLTSATTADGIWYLQDWALVLPTRQIRSGTGIIKDSYRKVEGHWKICYYEYRRVMEMYQRFPENSQITFHYLGEHGRKIANPAPYNSPA